MRFLRTAAAPAFVAVLAAGCSPVFDWREFRPEGTEVVILLPCKPSSYARDVRLAGQVVQLALQACTADGLTWALAYADLGDPARTSAALDELKASAMANLGATTSTALPFKLAGATPNAASGRLEIAGQLPDGRPVREQVAVFSKGTRVFQATVVGTSLPDEAMEAFFGGFRVSS